MQKLLTLIGVAVVAAAMYVAASSASPQAKAPTARQFNALKKQVATLSKTLKQVKSEANTAVGIIGTCYLTVSGNTATFNALPVSQFGTTTDGFLFGTSSTTPGAAAPRTALDINTTSPSTYLQEVTPTCITGGGLQNGGIRAGRSRVLRWAEHTR